MTYTAYEILHDKGILHHPPVPPVEHSTSIRPGVVGQIEAGRVGLGHEVTAVAETAQAARQEVEVIHLLKEQISTDW